MYSPSSPPRSSIIAPPAAALSDAVPPVVPRAAAEEESGDSTKDVNMEVVEEPAAKMPDQVDDDEVEDTEDTDRKLQNYEKVEEAAAHDDRH